MRGSRARGPIVRRRCSTLDPAQLRQGRVQRAPSARGGHSRDLAHQRRKVGSKRFVEEGLEAALGGRQGRRPSYVRKADGEFEARLVALSCAEPPEGHAQWSLRLLADRAVELGHIDSVSHETVRRVLDQAIGWVIPPQRKRWSRCSMCIAVPSLRRWYAWTRTPPAEQRDARAEPRRTGPASPARLRNRRCGTCNVFMAAEPLAGKHDQGRPTGHACSPTDRYPSAIRITLVMDNLNTHRPGALYETYPPAQAKALWDRFEFAPKHGSWLNIAEIELNVMLAMPQSPNRQCCAPRSPLGTARDRVQAKVAWSSPRTMPVSD